MSTASLELCQELYELSGWKDTDSRWYVDDGNFVTTEKLNGLWIPAYDLSYLLRKLQDFTDCHIYHASTVAWQASVLPSPTASSHIFKEADTPEDAACKLAIELIKEKVLKGIFKV